MVSRLGRVEHGISAAGALRGYRSWPSRHRRIQVNGVYLLRPPGVRIHVVCLEGEIVMTLLLQVREGSGRSAFLPIVSTWGTQGCWKCSIRLVLLADPEGRPLDAPGLWT